MTCKIDSIKSILTKVFFVVLVTFSSAGFCSVTMIGSRIIYPSDVTSVNVEFHNKDIVPYAVQTWLDDGDPMSTPATGKAPFSLSPAIFRISENSGQIQRISFNGSRKLPNDRESVFYFNFLQIPPLTTGGEKESNKNKNKMLIMLKNRVKVIYRPATLSADVSDMYSHIKVYPVQDNNRTLVIIENNTPYYASIVSVKLKTANGTFKKNAEMIAPFSKQTIDFKKKIELKKSEVAVDYINDQGARMSHNYEMYN